MQPLKLAFSLQRPIWSSLKGPGSLSDDDDSIFIGPSKNQSGKKPVLLAESDSDDSGQIVSAESGPNQKPELPPKAQCKMTSEPPKFCCQQAYNLEVCESISLA